MRGLHCSEDEAKAVLAYDKEVDHAGAKTHLKHDLSPEAEKLAKKFANAGTRKAPTVYKFDKPKERKANPTKEAIINELAIFLKENSENAVENVEIVNISRQISFKIGDNDYEITLTQKRKKK